MRNIILSLILVIHLVLVGCSGTKEVQFLAYVVGLGIDYIDDEYQVILQFLDFSNVAKTEQGKANESIPVWLAKGSGNTVETAIEEIYKNIQIQVNYDQLNLFLLGEGILERNLQETLQSLVSNFNVRLTGWVYGTNVDLENVFTAKMPFQYPYSISRMNQPQDMQHQNSTIPPITFRELLYMYNEKTKTMLIPSISLEDQVILQNKKGIITTYISGAYLVKNQTFLGWLSENDLYGFIQVNEASRRNITVIDVANTLSAIEVLKPHTKLVMKKEGYVLTSQIGVLVRESIEGLNLNKIKEKVSENIKKDVMNSYQKGRNLGADIFNLEDHAFRHHYDDWNATFKHQSVPELLEVEINIKPVRSYDKLREEEL
ncbi:Ger(x)C family spore germination protein [Sutcliffiella halmapala]|uniref:Ger(x)C family spore germination protein n=1 Tax=Sutcliffiella halmapala TaxID=79882 RepID=UPI000994D4EE|nr:Ger(x)C family spore germination C-terminal domain-containing protein [Sutcliffiella halmapala]